MFIQLQHKDSNRSSGFTIVELMIATVVFSMVLMVCSYAIVHVGRMYYKGVITSRTQDTSRKIVDDVVNNIVYNKPLALIRGSDPNTLSVCFGRVRYTYLLNKQLGPESNHVMWRDGKNYSASCSPLDLSQEDPGFDVVAGYSESYDSREMLGSNMRISTFDILEPCDPVSTPPAPGCPSGSSPDVWSINVSVSYGDKSDFEEISAGVPNYNLCKGVIAGGQFCAVSSYSTTVKSRL